MTRGFTPLLMNKPSVLADKHPLTAWPRKSGMIVFLVVGHGCGCCGIFLDYSLFSHVGDHHFRIQGCLKAFG
jgi:hypothetical protein